MKLLTLLALIILSITAFAQDKTLDFDGYWTSPAGIIHIEGDKARLVSAAEFGGKGDGVLFNLQRQGDEVFLVRLGSEGEEQPESEKVLLSRNDGGIELQVLRGNRVVEHLSLVAVSAEVAQKKVQKLKELKKLIMGGWELATIEWVDKKTQAVLDTFEARMMGVTSFIENGKGEEIAIYNPRNIDLCAHHGAVFKGGEFVGKFRLDASRCTLGLQQCEDHLSEGSFSEYHIDQKASDEQKLVLKKNKDGDNQQWEVYHFKRLRPAPTGETCTEGHAITGSSRDKLEQAVQTKASVIFSSTESSTQER